MNTFGKSIIVVLLLFIVLYFDFPTFSKLYSSDTSADLVKLKEHQERADEVLSTISKINLAILDNEKKAIRILTSEENHETLFQHPIFETILENKFDIRNEDGQVYLYLKPEFKDSFLSDYLTRINTLLDNTRKIESVNLDEKKLALVYTIKEGRRISNSTEPIATILGDQFDWYYLPDLNQYHSKVQESPYLVSLGLDLQGGIYLDVGIDLPAVYQSVLGQLKFRIEQLMLEDGIDFNEVKVLDDRTVLVVLSETENFDFNDERYIAPEENYGLSDAGLFVNSQSYTIEQDIEGYLFRLTDAEYQRLEENAFLQAIETIRNRIDELGVKEPSIQRKGNESIIIQLPGTDDPSRVKRLLTKSAILEFRLVVGAQNQNDEDQPGSLTLYQDVVDSISQEIVDKIAVEVSQSVAMGGDVVQDARVIFSQFGSAEVQLTFNARGEDIFADLTSSNIGKQLAIILDQKVQSAPVIQSSITGGIASITGSFTTEEARDLAIVLRSGSLPAPLIINEERTIGATLGADSIAQSQTALLIGFLLVIIIILVYYKLSGLYSILALLFNILIIIACLAYFQATLTLPGIAGIILTIGMAIDANVLIFERIREELDRNAKIVSAISRGFGKAIVTILDANITTMIAAIVLFQFGTGPIKGFAVTLSIGIIASMFTSIVFTRLLFQYTYIGKNKLKSISI